MTLENGFHDVPLGKVATVVTHLEMDAPVPTTPVSPPQGWTMQAVPNPEAEWYRALYRDVGSDWLWFSRLQMPKAELTAILQHPAVEVYSLRQGDVDGGIVELDFREEGRCELAFFGLTSALIGKGAGRYMMNFALETAWAHPIRQLYIHTCTLDSPQALSFYKRSGFVPVRQQIEIADDPRVLGIFDDSKAPHVPIFR